VSFFYENDSLQFIYSRWWWLRQCFRLRGQPRSPFFQKPYHNFLRLKAAHDSSFFFTNRRKRELTMLERAERSLFVSQ
jgi:hypothetical protein